MAVKVTKNNTKAILDALSADRLGRAVMAGAFILETEIKISMSARSHSGIVYGKHKASAPGETPAVDTAVLVNSIHSALVSSSEESAEAHVGTGVLYGPHLEFGTSKMDKRPFMRPAWDNKLEDIKTTIMQWSKKSIEDNAS